MSHAAPHSTGRRERFPSSASASLLVAEQATPGCLVLLLLALLTTLIDSDALHSNSIRQHRYTASSIFEARHQRASAATD